MIYLIIYLCDGKLNFQQILLQSSVSHDLSEIIEYVDLVNVCGNCDDASFLIEL